MIGGCVNWALMVNMTMYTCLPKRRSTANAVQMFTGHILGKSVRFTFNFRIFSEQVADSRKILGKLGSISGKLIHLLLLTWMSFPKSDRKFARVDQIKSPNFRGRIFLWNFLGDAFSPLLIGIIAEKLQSDRPESYYAEFTSLQYGMLLCPLLSALGMDQKLTLTRFFIGQNSFIKSSTRMFYFGTEMRRGDDVIIMFMIWE